MNILLKSFDGDPFDKPMLERALKGMQLGTVIAIGDHEQYRPQVQEKEHIWYNAFHLRPPGVYPFVDWNKITPLDEELIEKMRHAETMFFGMVTKYVKTEDYSYNDRKRQYYEHLRFWNHTLTEKKIDLVLMNHPPHQAYDYVIYCLAKLKGIKTLYLERFLTVDAMYMTEDWEVCPTDFRDHLFALRKEYADPGAKVPLSENYEYYFNYYRRKEQLKPWYQLKREDPGKMSFVQRWWKGAIRVLKKRPLYFLQSVASPRFWKRKLAQHKTLHLYQNNAKAPDFSVAYVYVALHHQPEASTSPQGGAYADQQLMVQMLAWCLPPEVKLYVKEHPTQGERMRSQAFYQSLLDIPQVQFIPRDVDTFKLIDNSLAVSSAIGSVIFEAILRQKPSFMFGHFLYQYGPGVEHVTSLEDCKRAVKNILEKPTHTERDVRIFLKAMDETGVPFVRAPDSPVEKYTQEEKAELMGAYIGKHIRLHMPEETLSRP